MPFVNYTDIYCLDANHQTLSRYWVYRCGIFVQPVLECMSWGVLTDSLRQRQPGSFCATKLPNTHSSDMAYYKYIFWYLFSSLNSRVEVLEDKGCVSFISISSAYGVGPVRSRWLENVFWMNDKYCPSYVSRIHGLHAHQPHTLQSTDPLPEDPFKHLLSKWYPKFPDKNRICFGEK